MRDSLFSVGLTGGGPVGNQQRAAEGFLAFGPHSVQSADEYRLPAGQRIGDAVAGQGQRGLGGEQVGRVLVDRPLDGVAVP